MKPPLDQLSPDQRAQIDKFERLLRQFNAKHNLISRSAASDLHAHHTAHALALTCRSFPAGSTVVDWGTGGGLPALPLAVALPNVHVHAVDSVRKKVMAVRAMARRLGLENVEVWHARAEEWSGEAHFSISRATAPLADLWRWHRRIALPLDRAPSEGEWPPGLLALKGGDLKGEIDALQAADQTAHVEQHDLYALLGHDHYKAKRIVHVSA